MGPLRIPIRYFSDFLRGCIDGDGCIDIRYHPESTQPQLRVRLYSASPEFLQWIAARLKIHPRLRGGWIDQGVGVRVLTYSKMDSIKLLNYIYYQGAEFFLKRKYKIAQPFLRM